MKGRLGCVGSSLLLVGSAAANESCVRVESNSEITANFAGREFSDGAHWTYRFLADGRIAKVTLGKGGLGTWRAENGLLCAEGGPGSAECHEVWACGQDIELRRDGAPPEVGRLTRVE